MKDTDQMLVGTIWTRAKGEHSPITGSIDGFNDRGPRLKLQDGSHRRLNWMELNFGWEPKDKRSADRYELWKLASKIDFFDEKIEGETKVKNGSAPVMTTPEVSVKECHGAWHKSKNGFELVPLSEFGVNIGGPRKGQQSAICNSCKAKYAAAPSKRPRALAPRTGVNKIEHALAAVIKPVTIQPEVITPEGTLYRWRVIVVQPTEHFVHAKDFLDAAAQVASLGEVTRVEKL